MPKARAPPSWGNPSPLMAALEHCGSVRPTGPRPCLLPSSAHLASWATCGPLAFAVPELCLPCSQVDKSTALSPAASSSSLIAAMKGPQEMPAGHPPPSALFRMPTPFMSGSFRRVQALLIWNRSRRAGHGCCFLPLKTLVLPWKVACPLGVTAPGRPQECSEADPCPFPRTQLSSYTTFSTPSATVPAQGCPSGWPGFPSLGPGGSRQLRRDSGFRGLCFLKGVEKLPIPLAGMLPVPVSCELQVKSCPEQAACQGVGGEPQP